jgi:hypothetical protein
MAKLAEYCTTCGDRGSKCCNGEAQDCARAITDHFNTVVIPAKMSEAYAQGAEETAKDFKENLIPAAIKDAENRLIDEIDNLLYINMADMDYVECRYADWQQFKEKYEG